MEFDWVIRSGLGWFVGPQLLLCDGLVEEIGPTDNSGSAPGNSLSFPPSVFFESSAAWQQPQHQLQRPCDVLYNELIAADSEQRRRPSCVRIACENLRD